MVLMPSEETGAFDLRLPSLSRQEAHFSFERGEQGKRFCGLFCADASCKAANTDQNFYI